MKRPSLCFVLVIAVLAGPLMLLGSLWLWAFAVRPIFSTSATPWGCSVDMRISIGDLRFQWLGVTYRRQTLPVGTREQLFQLASEPPRVPDRWVRVADRSANYFQYQYSFIPAWAKVSPEIAKAAHWELANWLEASHGEIGATDVNLVLRPDLFEMAERGGWRLRSGWKDDTHVKWFVEEMEEMGIYGVHAGKDNAGAPAERR